jgi:hypothetical protein
MTQRSWMAHPVVGGIVGVFAGGLTVMLCEVLGHALFGTADPNDLSTITTPMLASVLASWILGAAVAGFVATHWTGARSIWPGTISALVLFAGSVATLFAIPHPVWMTVATVALMPAAGWLAASSSARATRTA